MVRRAGVGFDLGETLCEYAGVPLNWEQEYPAAFAAVAAACGRPLTADGLESGNRVLARYNTRLTPRDDDCEYRAEEIFSEILASWGCGAHLLEPSIGAFFLHFRQKLQPFPDSARVLKELAELGVPTGVLTDVPYGMPRSMVASDLAKAQLAFPDARLLTSTMVGYRKPNPAGFRELARTLAVSPQELIYVGNERKDILGSNAAGALSVLLWRPDGDVPDWGQAFTIRTLDGLLPLLE